MADDPSDSAIQTAPARILVVDDEFTVRDSLQSWFEMDGYEVHNAADAQAGLRALQQYGADVVLLDIRMPGIDGLELQRRIHGIDPSVVVIMITAFASVDTAVQALKAGAFDYVTKPIDPDHLSQLVARGLEQRRRQGAIGDASCPDCPRLITESAVMRRLAAQLDAAAAADSAVTFRGEPGSGRERFAHYLHSRSERRNFPFVTLDCAAFDDLALEGELFGHERGAFEGAHFLRKGKLEMAAGGSLLLERIEALSPRMQSALLQALENGEFRRLGGDAPIALDLRILTTTDCDLEQRLAAARFREDLYYRLTVITLVAPPLRERIEDIPALAAALLADLAEQTHRGFAGFEAEAVEWLRNHPWTRNVTELEHVIAHAVAIGSPPLLRVADLADAAL